MANDPIKETESNVEQKKIVVEREVLFVKVRINKDHLDSIKVYAEMIHLDEDRVFEHILATGIKTIRGHLNNLPYTSTQKLFKRYQVASVNNLDTEELN